MPKNFAKVKVTCPVSGLKADVYFLRSPSGEPMFSGCDTFSCNFHECSTVCKELAYSLLIDSVLFPGQR